MSLRDRYLTRLAHEAEQDANAPPDSRDVAAQKHAELYRLSHRDACARLSNALDLLEVWDGDDDREQMRRTLTDLMRIVSGDPSYGEVPPETWEV